MAIRDEDPDVLMAIREEPGRTTMERVRAVGGYGRVRSMMTR